MNMLAKYSQGNVNEKPNNASVVLADFIIKECLEKSLHYDIYVSEYDFSLIIECKTRKNEDVFINLFTDGILDISVYNDQLKEWIINLPYATKQDFAKIFTT